MDEWHAFVAARDSGAFVSWLGGCGLGGFVLLFSERWRRYVIWFLAVYSIGGALWMS